MAERSRQSVLYRLGRELRYRALPELIGRKVTIRSVEAIEETLQELVRPWLGDGARMRSPEVRYAELALIKYGLIDAELVGKRELLEGPGTLVGLEALRECGFLPRRGERWKEEETEGGEEFLATLDEELIRDGCVLKLMLKDGLSTEAHLERATGVLGGATAGVKAAVAGILPREFTVEDACVTNSGYAWFARYFYV